MIETTFEFRYKGTYDDITTSKAEQVVAGKYLKRNTLEDAVHHEGVPVYDSTYPFLMENRNLHELVSGSWEISWEWSTGQFTEEQIDIFMSLTDTPNASTVKDFVNNRVVRTIPDANYAIPDWTENKGSVTLPATTATLTATSEGEIFCPIIINSQYSTYTVESITVEPGESLSIAKDYWDNYYLIFMGEMYTEGNPLTPFKVYSLTSPVKVFTNNGTERVRITRIYR